MLYHYALNTLSQLYTQWAQLSHLCHIAATVPSALQSHYAALATQAQTMTADLWQRAIQVASVIERLQQQTSPQGPNQQPVILSLGSATLRDYGEPTTPEDAPVIVCIPSLINHPYILDIAAEHSLMRFLAQQGFHPYLICWDHPTKAEEGFSINEYVTERVEPFMHAIYARHQRPLFMLGHCLGGMIALAAACRNTFPSAGLVLMSVPWDFTPLRQRLAALLPGWAEWAALLATTANVTIPMVSQLLHYTFFWLNPAKLLDKLMPNAEPVHPLFEAVEYWLNDTLTVALPVFHQCMHHFMIENTVTKGLWHVGNTCIDHRKLTIPRLVLTAERDHIVPATSSTPLLTASNVSHLHIDSGHLGMITSSRAPTTVWQPLCSWIKNHAAA
jgi:polyhydroxyalkanoate synthase